MDDKYFRLVDKLLDKAEWIIDNTPEWNSYSLKELSTAMKYLKECKGVKTDTDLREQEARIRNLEKQAEQAEESKDVVVTIASEAEEYSV